jgi:hypothetical protein
MEPFGFRMILILLPSLIVAAKGAIASSAVLNSSTIRLERQRIPSRKIGASALAHSNRTGEAIVEGDRTGVVLAPSALPPPERSSQRRSWMTLSVKNLSGLILISLSVALAGAEGKVNFSGTWILDKSKSDVSQFIGIGNDTDQVQNASMTMVVEQQGVSLRVTRILKSQGDERKEIHTYKLDGKETTNVGFRGETVVARAFWEGDRLVVVSTRTKRVLMKEISGEIRGVWSLSPDGKILTIAAQVHSPRGEQRLKAVFDKQ